MIWLMIAISVLGLLLLGALVERIIKADRTMKLERHRSRAEGLGDLLNYAAVVDDGVIIGKNGAFMTGWIYTGADNESSTEEERELLSYRINQALARLGSGWMIHVDAIRCPTANYSKRSQSYFPDPVSAAIDEERRAMCEHRGNLYEGQFVLTVSYFPPLLAEQRFVALLFDDDAAKASKKTQTQQLLEQFKREVETIETRLSSAFKLSRLGLKTQLEENGTVAEFDEFLSHLQFCITGLRHRIRLPENPIYIDKLIGGQELWGGVTPRVGRKFVQVVAIDGFPLESQPGMLTELAELPVEYRWSSRYIFLDRHEALTALEKYRAKWEQKRIGFWSQVFHLPTTKVNQDAINMVADADTAITEINSGEVGMGYYTSAVILMDEDRQRVEAVSRQIEKAINNLGFTARVESVNTLDAFFGSLPGHGVENMRRPLLHTLNWADLLPTSTIPSGESTAPCPFYPPDSPPLMHCVTTGSSPFRLNLHVRDLGHTMMFGPTSAGKSTHLALIMAQLRRYKDMRIFVFDKGLSLYALTKAMRGNHYQIGGDVERLAFAPLQYLETRSDRAWALEWLETILRLNSVEPSPNQRKEIVESLANMIAQGHHTISDFLSTVQDNDIRSALSDYTVDKPLGHVFDATSDGLGMSDLMTFEIEELMNLNERFALPILLYLFRRIERSLKGQPAAIILDEAWLMLQHDVFREKIRQWLRVLRKANCIVIMATQNVSDAVRSGILDVINEATPTKIYLPNAHALGEDAMALYRRLGLNRKQIEILATAIPKQQYYYVSERGRRLYELALGPLTLAFCGVSDKDSVAEVMQHETQYGSNWVHEWLRRKGLSLSDYVRADEFEKIKLAGAVR
jgi:type IV secretion system protein TrbE